jgi:hypothetical protein
MKDYENKVSSYLIKKRRNAVGYIKFQVLQAVFEKRKY